MSRPFIVVVVVLLAGLFQMPAASVSARTQQTQEEQILALTQQVVDLTIQANDEFWTARFDEWNYPEPLVYYVTLRPGDSYTLACKDKRTGRNSVMTGDTKNAVYCSADQAEVNGVMQHGVIYVPLWPLAMMVGGDMWGHGAIPPGNYAAVAMISHEFAHHIEHELSVIRGIQRPGNPEIELLADCLAGRFMRNFDLIDPLTEDQIEAILLGWGLIGDSNADVNSHGTADERRTALLLGYEGGPNAELTCLSTYYPAIMR